MSKLKFIARKPFKARGSHVIRCANCLMAKTVCICAYRSSIKTRAQFVVLMHPHEQYKPTNTGRLIQDCFESTRLFFWSRTYIEKEFLFLLNQKNYQPWLVFPADQLDCQDRVQAFQQTPHTKPPLFILIDGTWRQARRIFRHSAYLSQLPLLSLTENYHSQYQLRKTHCEQHLCTAEVAISLLRLSKEQKAAEHLNDYFTAFQAHYLASRNNQTIQLPSALENRLLANRKTFY